eukprot:Gregarina_sp_Poly_1__11428@NODE_976_length_5498_cov_252_990794_g689_i0_p3_GENE_NODE_976_length_5498_cov_252_990794_g689_i0NODE_976_length_5498_cov_252_990794_g689_i0_p3_ORF_typecomplete_len238_score21_35Tfb4/PF03850_14/3_7e19NAD_binding_2/PF03446_15/0_32_NODE_976_length_5498_cov_252_990794_g689_i031813894
MFEFRMLEMKRESRTKTAKKNLAVVIDVSPWAFDAFRKAPRTSSWHAPTLGQYLNAICEFLAQYSVLHAENTLVIIAAHSSDTQVLFRGIAGDLHLDTIKEAILLKLLPRVDNTGISLMTLAIAQSLCHLSLMCSDRNAGGRILIISCESTDRVHGVSKELLSLAFAAKTLKVVVDLATVYPVATPAWPQMCQETGGCYLNLVNNADVKTWSLNENVTAELQKAPGKLFASMLAVRK